MKNVNLPRIISWSKYRDVFGKDQPEYEWTPEQDVQHKNIYEEEDEEEDDEHGVGMDNIPVVVLPMGILPIRPFNNITKAFNFWMGETTFNIDNDQTINVFDSTPGVEIFDIFTRYRFRIAVGNNFDFQFVRQLLEERLDAVPVKPTNTLKSNIELSKEDKVKIETLKKSFGYWSAYFLPNGECSIVTSSENSEDFQRRVDVQREALSLAGGILSSHEGEWCNNI